MQKCCAVFFFLNSQNNILKEFVIYWRHDLFSHLPKYNMMHHFKTMTLVILHVPKVYKFICFVVCDISFSLVHISFNTAFVHCCNKIKKISTCL